MKLFVFLTWPAATWEREDDENNNNKMEIQPAGFSFEPEWSSQDTWIVDASKLDVNSCKFLDNNKQKWQDSSLPEWKLSLLNS